MEWKRHRAMICVFLLATLWISEVQAEDIHFGPEDSPLQSVKYAEIRIQGEVVEILPPLYVVRPQMSTTYGILEGLERARKDKSIDGVVLRVDRMEAGWGKVEEMRAGIEAIREEGKEVICFLQGAGELEYYLATAADRIVMRRSASLMLTGLRAEVVFLKRLLDKVGVEAEMVQVGEYKGGAEALTRDGASEPLEESINSLLNGLYKRLSGAIAERMDEDEESATSLIDEGPYTGRRAQEAGLVDELAFYRDYLAQLQQKEKGPFILSQRYGEEERQEPPLGAGAKEMMQTVMGMGSGFSGDEFPEGPTIAIVYAVGPIVRDDPNNMPVGDWVVNAERMAAYIRRLRKRENVQAVVLRVNSPGGDAEASDVIWRELRKTNEEKPVIVSMSDVAASGGYYIASGGRYILADAGTLTGSIGVVGGKVVYKELLEKVGVTVDVFQRGKNAGMFSSTERFSESQEQRFTGMLEETYRIFLDRVAESRHMTQDELEPSAQGRPLTGAQAKEGGLVDEIGGLQRAIEKAKVEAGISDDTSVSIVRVPNPESVLKVLFAGRDPGVKWPALTEITATMLPRDVRRAVSYVNVARELLEGNEAAALLPMHVEIR